MYSFVNFKSVKNLNIEISFSLYDSSVGKLFIASTETGICSLEISDNLEHCKLNLYKLYGDVKIKERRSVMHVQALNAVEKLLSGDGNTDSITFHVNFTPFELKVWRKLVEIDSIPTISYSDFGALIGSPRRARAVGNTLSVNPIAILIPCHKVIKKNGEYGNYKWGNDMKRKIITRSLKGK